MKHFVVISEDIFYRQLVVAIGMEANEVIAELKKRVKKEYLKNLSELKRMISTNTSSGQCFIRDGVISIIVIKKEEEDENFISTLAHELLHAVFHMARQVDVSFSEDSEEWFTYMYGFFFQEVYKSIYGSTRVESV